MRSAQYCGDLPALGCYGSKDEITPTPFQATVPTVPSHIIHNEELSNLAEFRDADTIKVMDFQARKKPLIGL